MAVRDVLQARAVARRVPVSPYKARAVVDLVRGKPVEEALDILRWTQRRAARAVRKVVQSAVANATHNMDLDERRLRVVEAYVDQGPVMKRFQPRARGQAYPILKRSCHITIVVAEGEEG